MRHQSTVLAGVAALLAPDLASASARQRGPGKNKGGSVHPKKKQQQPRPSESPTFSPSTWFPTFFPTISPVTAEQEAAMRATPPPTPLPTRRPTKRKQPTPDPTKRPTRRPTREPTANPTPNPTPDTPQLGRPVASGLVPAQAVSIAEDGPFTLLVGTDFASIPVLENDVGDGLVVRAIVADAENGSCDIDLSMEAVIYTPDAGYAGSDSCSYEACDADDNCGTALVRVQVKADATASPTEGNSRGETPPPSPAPVAPVTPAGTEQTLSPTVPNVRSTPFPTESTPEPTTPPPTPEPKGYDDYVGDSKKKEYGYGGNEHGEDWYPGYGRDHRVGKSGKTKGGKSGYSHAGKAGKSGAWGKSGKTKGVSGPDAGGYSDDAWSWIPGAAAYGGEPAWGAANYGGSDSWLAYDGDSKTAKAESTWEGAHAYAGLQGWYGDDGVHGSKTHKEPDWSAPHATNHQAWYGDDYVGTWSGGPTESKGGKETADSKGGKESDWGGPNLQAWYGDDYAQGPAWSPPAAAWHVPQGVHGVWAGGDDYAYDVSAKGGKRHRRRRQ